MTVTLRDVVEVRGGFHRSIQLVRDWNDKQGLQQYLLTSTARSLATRIIEGIQTPGGVRAWSITGPYGTGKSAFALFLTYLLAESSPEHRAARELRRETSLENKPFVPVLLVGQRSPLIPAFLRALSASLRSKFPRLSEKVDNCAHQRHIPDEAIVTLVEEVANTVADGGSGGLLVVWDEFGKFLEYAAQHPESEDLLVMQHLAELAARSPVPITLITILHTSFAEYLHRADETQRVEWQKVQGRFVDVAFQEPPEQVLKLIGSALVRNMPVEMEAVYRQSMDCALSSPALTEARRRIPIDELLPLCAPLDPITALLLWPLFRAKLAQNERSLFAFLVGYEPFGFAEFLSYATWVEGPPPLYRLNDIYDYVTCALGPASYIGDRAHRWAGISDAIDRVRADAPPLTQEVIKAIGLLGLYGPAVGLKASRSTLEICLGDPEAVSQVLAYLERSSIAIYRRHEGAYGLWEGSDVDLDACLEEAHRHVGQGDLAQRIKQDVTLQPVVARAHYIQTGTLRYFSADIIEGTEDALRRAIKESPATADGKILYILTRRLQEREGLIKLAVALTSQEAPEYRLRILAFPRPVVGLEAALEEVEAWVWINEHVPALQGDPVARQEVRARIQYAQERLEDIVGQVIGLRGYPVDPEASEWIQGGRVHNPKSTRDFLQWLSRLCDEVFHSAPRLRNELLNRNRLSSAAAKARRNLLEAMLTREGEEALGFRGTPPEVSMYRSMLIDGGFHRFRNGQLQFQEPNEEWQPVWQALERFLETTQEHRRPIQELIAALKASPFGLREGPIPILLSLVLLTHHSDVALYEDGIFVPELRIEVLERLLRVPESFEIQQYMADAPYQDIVSGVRDIICALQLPQDTTATPHLLQIVKPLVMFAARLPNYTKNTRRLDPAQAIAVRDALLKARDPYELIFIDLPAALGIGSRVSESTDSFVSLLRECLLGLHWAYPRLLDEVEHQVREVFGLPGTSEEVRKRIQSRAIPLDGYTADRELSLFVRESTRLGSRGDWREALARAVNGGTPPTQWRDMDVVSFQVRLRQLASDFVRLEELVAEKERTGATRILRIGLLDGKNHEAREVVAIPPERQPLVESLATRIEVLLAEVSDQSEEGRRLRLAALAQVAGRYLHRNGAIIDE